MTRLRELMLDELQRRNYAGSKAEAYIHAVKDFSTYYHKPPDKLGLSWPKTALRSLAASGRGTSSRRED
jgi:hypothetical protein